MEFEEKTQKFVDWMQSVGIELSKKVKIEDYRNQNQGRGLKATEDITAGEKLFSIPQSALITGETAPELQELIRELNEWPKLMVTMMFLANKHWKPYFEVLPTEFNTPMFWSKEQLTLLEGSAVVDKIGRDEAIDMYNSLKPIFESDVFNGIDTSEEAFHRMGSLIMAYGFDIGNEETIKAMVPPADMLNSHSKLVNARLEMPEEDGGMLDMIATEDISAGAQIYNFYGEQPNSDLLRRYGYVEQGGNASDVAEISLEALIRAGGLSEKSLDMWDKYDEAEVIDEAFDIGDQGIPDPDIIAMANLLTETPSKKSYKKCLEMAEEEQLTEKAREILIDAVEERLRDYPSEIEELPTSTEEVYVDVPTMCKQVLFTEKHILKMCLSWLGGAKRRKVK